MSDVYSYECSFSSCQLFVVHTNRIILLSEICYFNLSAAMVGGGYTGFVKYEPYTFDPDYFVPRSSSSTSSSCDVPSPEIEVSSVAESEPALISSTVSQTATEKADVTTAPGEELSPVVADKFNNAAVEISSNSSGPDTAATGVRARSTAAAAAATTTAAYSNSTAKEGCTGGNKSSKCSTTMASTSITTSTHESEPEDMSFGIISMRTSGY